MSVVVMQVKNVTKHPNADALNIYDFEAPYCEDKQIVANLDNVYEVGDLVFVALEGSVLKDGTKIKPCKIRGVASYGMALGHCNKLDAKPGDNFTHLFCVEEKENVDTKGFSIIKWPDIELFHNVRRDLKKSGLTPTIKYLAKVKLDGCFHRTARVTLADGTKKPIGQIKPGDYVFGVDKTNKIVRTKVIDTFKNGRTKEWVKILGCRGANGFLNTSAIFSIMCTPNHLIWCKSKNSYVEAKDLKSNDVVCMFRNFEVSLTFVQEQILLGKLLGDATLNSTSCSSHVEWGHVEYDLEYLKWTMKGLGSLANKKISTYISGYGSVMKRARTFNSAHIKHKFISFYEKEKKSVPEWVADELTPLSLAFWYMDDGSLSHNDIQKDRAIFHTCDFTEEDCIILVKGLNRFGINAAIRNGKKDKYPTIYLDTEGSEKLFLLIAPYITPCMKRKLPEHYQNCVSWLPKTDNRHEPSIVERKIIKVEKLKPVSGVKYDIQTNTSNYFVNGILVHNSNGGIQINPDGRIAAQSRSRIITPQKDNLGFAGWVYKNEDYFSALKQNEKIILYGEWGGCLYHDTPILLSDGTPRKIGEIVNKKEKLSVLTYNFETNKLEPKRIINWLKQEDNNNWLTVNVKRRHRGGKSTRLILTKNHMVYIKRKSNIVEIPAKKLFAGDVVFVQGRILGYHQLQFIMGSLIGDGSFDSYGMFKTGHSDDDQPFYNKFIKKLLANMGFSSKRISGHGSNMTDFTSQSFPEVKNLQDLLIKDGIKKPSKKYLDKMHPPAFAAWYMDDGSLAGGHNGRQYQCDISTFDFGKKVTEELSEWFREHGFDCYVCKCERADRNKNKQHFLRFSPQGAEAFLRMIAPYVIKQFNYKLPPYLRKIPKINWHHQNPIDGIVESVVLSVEDGNPYTQRYKRYRYDIEVEDNHNFFANHVLVHNSGIQKRTAISKIDRRIFVVFAIQFGVLDAKIEINPDNIAAMLPKHPDIFVLPFYGPKFVCDFSDTIKLQDTIEEINKLVEDVEKTDPWVQSVFGIEGLGEGVVMYPLIGDGKIPRHTFSEYIFKAKGEKHKVVNSKKPVQIDPTFVKNINEFVKLFATENRFEQGITVACNNEYDMKHMGNFLKWFSQDVKKESKAELEAAGLEFKQVNKQLTRVAKEWFLKQLKK